MIVAASRTDRACDNDEKSTRGCDKIVLNKTSPHTHARVQMKWTAGIHVPFPFRPVHSMFLTTHLNDDQATRAARSQAPAATRANPHRSSTNHSRASSNRTVRRLYHRWHSRARLFARPIDRYRRGPAREIKIDPSQVQLIGHTYASVHRYARACVQSLIGRFVLSYF